MIWDNRDDFFTGSPAALFRGRGDTHALC